MQPVSPVILVVDDDPSIGELLQRTGYTAALATDGDTALARLTAGRIDLVLLDRRLADTDGIELCQRMRAQACGAALPIIILSTLDPERAREAALAAGATDYLAKPFDIQELLDHVQVGLNVCPQPMLV